MANKTISRVSLDELNEARDDNFSLSENTTNSLEQTKTNSYVARLKDDEIKDFFTPFGFVSMQRQNADIKNQNDFDLIYVLCDNFEVALSDFEIIVQILRNSAWKPEPFDINAFLHYCDTIDVEPQKALADLIQTQLLGQRFHSYAKRLGDKKQKERKNAFEELPKAMKKHLAIIDEKREHEIDGMQNKLMYGSFSGDPRTKN